MYYEEKFENGILYYRSMPNGQWRVSRGIPGSIMEILGGANPAQRMVAFNTIKQFFCIECGFEKSNCVCVNEVK